jgi:hypothetical protein
VTSREFCYWLQGYFEIKDAHRKTVTESPGMDGEQVQMIQRHLALVFKHEIDPSYPDAAELNKIHHGGKGPAFDSGTLLRC